MLYGIVSWGLLVGIAGGIIVSRLHTSQTHRAPLPALVAALSPGEHSAWKDFPDYRNVVPVLVYHSVAGTPSYITTSRTLFAEQMRALRVAGFHTLTIQQYARYVKHGPRGLPSRPILLTFDDGRLDGYRGSNNLLKLYKFHATELVVPAWVGEHPAFSLSWTQLDHMARSGIWSIQEHFGYGQEEVRVNQAGEDGGTFGNLQYIPGPKGHPGHLEKFANFKGRLAGNMAWGKSELQQEIPGFQSYSMAVPESDYGQNETNDQRIPPYTLSWLDRHYEVVFGGDYLDRGVGHKYQVSGRFSRKLSPRMSMGPRETLGALYCRLRDWIRNVAVWKEYRCLRIAQPKETVLPGTHPLIYSVSPVSPLPPAKRGKHQASA